MHTTGKRPREVGMGVERALRGWRCRVDEEGMLCDACRQVSRIAADTQELPTLALYLVLQQTVGCPNASAAYRAGLRPMTEPVASDSDSDDDTVGPPGTPPFDALPLPLPQLPPPEPTWGALTTAWTPAMIAALQRRFTVHSNALNRVPAEARIRVEFTRTKHDYYIDGVKCSADNGWYSPSGLIKKLFKPFDAIGIAKRLSTMTSGKWAGRTWEDIVAEWDGNRDSGSAKHNAYDKWLQHEPLETGDADANPILPPPVGFYRAMASLVDRFDVWRTEMSLFAEHWKLLGQADLVLVERATGLLWLADFKNCKDLDLYDASKTRDRGIHPFTAALADTKGAHYDIQLEAYRRMLVLMVAPLGLAVAPTKILLNFRPEEPDYFYRYDRPAYDLDPLLALMPWHDADPWHALPAPPPPSLAGALVPPVPDDDPDVQPAAEGPEGDTRRCAEVPRGGLPADGSVVWTGKRYVKGEYDFPADSPWAHPKRWFGPPPPTAYGEYEAHLLKTPALLARLGELAGKQLACWCRKPEERCHADVLVKYARAYARKPEWRAAVATRTIVSTKM
jgi:hypothetical protein